MLDRASIDAVVTDPPYASTGAASSFVTVDKVRGFPREYQFYEAWWREILAELMRVLKPSGAIWMTIDWRGAMALDRASSKFPLSEPKIGVWHRGGLGMGHVLRNVYECFAVMTCSEWKRRKTDEPDVWSVKWTPSDRRMGHSAEKPIELMSKAIELLADPGSTILDPFAGSGTTAVACAMGGYNCIAIEREAEYVSIIADRLADLGEHERPVTRDQVCLFG